MSISIVSSQNFRPVSNSRTQYPRPFKLPTFLALYLTNQREFRAPHSIPGGAIAVLPLTCNPNGTADYIRRQLSIDLAIEFRRYNLSSNARFRPVAIAMTLVKHILAEVTVINILLILAVTFIVIPLGVWLYDSYRFRALPPGPPTRPFIGNKHLIPSSRPWLKMTEWSEIYVHPPRRGSTNLGFRDQYIRYGKGGRRRL